MKSASKNVALNIAERCKNILSANWQAHLNTIKADAKGSKEDIHTSKIHYLFKRGKPYIWIREGDLHNTNIILDERSSLAVCSSVPGPLASLLRSLRKSPARVALVGDILPLKDEKVQFVAESLKESVLLEHKTVSQASYSVSGILSAASISCKSRSESFQEILDESANYAVYKFNVRSCTYVEGSGDSHEVEVDEVEAPKSDLLLPFSEKLIDGINQSQARRRALMLFCFEYLNMNARDAFILAIDKKGFDVLAKVPVAIPNNGISQYQWKEFRFTFKEAARDLEAFCHLLVEMEEEVLEKVNSYSGLG